MGFVGAQQGTPESPRPHAGLSDDLTMGKDWSLELGSGVGFSNIRSSDNARSTMIPITLTATLKLDEVSLEDGPLGGWLRGYSEFFFRGIGAPTVHGVENRFLGASFGPRYNFVQPGWRVVPFVEAGVGFLFADTDPRPAFDGSRQTGMGQDFNFMFSVSAGVRYDMSEDWFMRLQVTYLHASNAGLSEPRWLNKPLDSIGPEVSFGVRF